MTRTRLIWACLLSLAVAACTGTIETDPDVSSADQSALPTPEDEVDNAALAAALAAEPDLADPLAFDSDDAAPTNDVPVTDADDGTDVAGLSSTDDPVTVYATHPLLKAGLHPRASDALRSVGVTSARISQTIGNAVASAGFHKIDGYANGVPYCAATDISVSGLTSTQIKHLLERLGRVGFAAWYRQPGHDGWPSYDAPHIHAVYANLKMKSVLRAQVRDWLVGRTGLVGDGVYHFYKWSTTAITEVRHKFGQSANGTTNGGSTCVAGGDYCGGDKISGSTSALYRCTGQGAPALIAHCSAGCAVNPGRNDACR